jgi:hypothetical protein
MVRIFAVLQAETRLAGPAVWFGISRWYPAEAWGKIG